MEFQLLSVNVKYSQDPQIRIRVISKLFVENCMEKYSNYKSKRKKFLKKNQSN